MPLPYNMYLFNLRIANHILIKIFNKARNQNPFDDALEIEMDPLDNDGI